MDAKAQSTVLNDIILDALNLDGKTVLHAAKQAVELGFRSIWLTEGIERESFALAAAISPLLGTETRVGSNLTNAYTRTPLLIAMSALTLDEITNQRFFLTIGSGGIGYVQKCHGIKFELPLARVREYMTFVRKVLNGKVGDRITFDGRFYGGISFTQRSAIPEGTHIDIYMSGLNPKMIQLAGELSDGLVLSHAPLEALDDVKRNIEIGAKKAGRDPAEIKIFVNSPVGLDTEEGIESLRKLIAFHIAAPTYQYLLDLSGYGEETKLLRAAWEGKDPKKATKIVTDDIIRLVGLGYTQKDIRDKAQKLQNSGAIPIIYPAVGSQNATEDIVQIMTVCKKATA
jgi:5,10-methylenetetrahydromethanopterin reductase